jgi:hypothetical protein
MTEKLNSSNLRQNPRNVNELVNELTLFDDDLMSRVFDKNIKATELLLRIILGKKVKVISVTGQNEMKNHQVGRRNITLDVDAMDETLRFRVIQKEHMSDAHVITAVWLIRECSRRDRRLGN